jgi:hypothetical protein
MQVVIQIILLAYKMEGIKASDVAVLVTKESGATVFRCMSPQQHNAYRAVGIKQRLERNLCASPDAECEVQPGTVYADGQTQTMHTVVVHYFAKVC